MSRLTMKESTQQMYELCKCECVCAGAWGDFVGVDAAMFQEVVEHLDPGPLGWLGPCLLAALQPRLLLLSTPNAEYNPVLHHLQPQALAHGKRNSDHRFEWYARATSYCKLKPHMLMVPQPVNII